MSGDRARRTRSTRCCRRPSAPNAATPAAGPTPRAIAAGEADINQCPPGGAAGIGKLAALLGRASKPLDPANGAERARALALIDETRCIGCTLCIQACPVDAIVGAAKLMHTVIAELCTGCELCLPPCPVDCIDMVPVPPAQATWTRAMADAARARSRVPQRCASRASGASAPSASRARRRKAAQPMPDARRPIRRPGTRQSKEPQSRRGIRTTVAADAPKSPPSTRASAAGERAMNPAKRREIFARLRAANPEPRTELEYRTPFELLVAVILSAQATDKSVNLATRSSVQGRAYAAERCSALGMDGLIAHIKTHRPVPHQGEEHPRHLPHCCSSGTAARCRATARRWKQLPGVGRKTANVVLNIAFGQPTIAVDTHIFRVANRTGIAPGQGPARGRAAGC